MDIVDQAQETQALYMAAALAEIHGAAPVLLATGLCHNCQAEVHGRDRFCDSFCRDDYALRKASEARRGIVRHG
jgi:hypothetical protein